MQQFVDFLDILDVASSDPKTNRKMIEILDLIFLGRPLTKFLESSFNFSNIQKVSKSNLTLCEIVVFKSKTEGLFAVSNAMAGGQSSKYRSLKKFY